MVAAAAERPQVVAPTSRAPNHKEALAVRRLPCLTSRAILRPPLDPSPRLATSPVAVEMMPGGAVAGQCEISAGSLQPGSFTDRRPVSDNSRARSHPVEVVVLAVVVEFVGHRAVAVAGIGWARSGVGDGHSREDEVAVDNTRPVSVHIDRIAREAALGTVGNAVVIPVIARGAPLGRVPGCLGDALVVRADASSTRRLPRNAEIADPEPTRRRRHGYARSSSRLRGRGAALEFSPSQISRLDQTEVIRDLLRAREAPSDATL